MYSCRATVTRVVDGDTLYVDMGFDLRQKMELHFSGPNTLGIPGPGRARGPLIDMRVVDNARALGKFGCCISDLYCLLRGESDAQKILAGQKPLNQKLLDEGLAECVDHD